MSSRRKKQQKTTKLAESDDQPVGKRLRCHRTSATASEPATPSTSSKSKAPAKSNNQNQPQPNSLLHLNDKCLQAVFERLDIDSLCRTANVCKRFRAAAEQVFSQNHKQFRLDGRTSTISIVRRVLCKFGHLMTSFDASEAYFDDPSGFVIGAIVKYCSNTLDELYLHNVTIDCTAAVPLFRQLKKLFLTMCDFTGTPGPAHLFTNTPKLEFLGFEAKESCRFLARKYPKLEELSFDVAYPGYFTFFELLALNPQLRRLTIMGLPEDIYISTVVKHTKSMEQLMITPGVMTSTPEIQTKSGFLQLSKLKQLKKLSLNAGYEIYGKLVGPLIDAFAKEKIQLDQLELKEFSIHSKDIKSILKIKTIEILVLDVIEQANEADVIAMATELPKLSTLHLYFGSKAKNPITINGLTKIVKNRTKLVYLALVDVQNLKIDKRAFENLMKEAENRRGVNEKKLTIDIFGHKKTTSFTVPDAMRKSNNAFLEIRYRND